MQELGYVPNLVAGSLASARTRLIGVLVPTIAHAIFADTIQGLSDVLEPQGFAVILAQSGYDAAREERVLSALLGRRPDALVMVGSPATADGARMLQRRADPRGGNLGVAARADRCGRRVRQLCRWERRWPGTSFRRDAADLAFIGGNGPESDPALAGLPGRRQRLLGLPKQGGWCWTGPRRRPEPRPTGLSGDRCGVRGQ